MKNSLVTGWKIAQCKLVPAGINYLTGISQGFGQIANTVLKNPVNRWKYRNEHSLSLSLMLLQLVLKFLYTKKKSNDQRIPAISEGMSKTLLIKSSRILLIDFDWFFQFYADFEILFYALEIGIQSRILINSERIIRLYICH